MAKGDPRAAAERLEKGIERYGDGDMVAAAVEFEEALRLSPEHSRAAQYLAWVKDVLAGTRGPNKKKDLDEDAVRAITEALDEGNGEAEAESPWAPVPLQPSKEEKPAPARAMETVPDVGEPDEPAPAASPPPNFIIPALDFSAPAESSAPKDVVPAPHQAEQSPAGTILGIAPVRDSILTPLSKQKEMTVDRPDSVTKEFQRGTPTLHNLQPLDVPELTEEQIAELISLESSLPTTGPTGKSLAPDIATTPDLPTERKAFIEFEAEATPPPHRFPTMRDRRKDDTSPEASLKLQPLPFASDFDPMEMTPTRARVGSLPPSPVLNPLPIDDRPDLADHFDDGSDGGDEVTQNPTNPFIRSKLATYAYPPTDEDDLPPQPTARKASPTPSIGDILATAKRALDENSAANALDIADEVVTKAGGVDSEPCLPYLSLLEKIYESVIGPFEKIPEHGGSVPDLDPRAAFLLSRIDGNLSVDDLLDVSGMPRLEAMRVLALLVRRGIVVMK